MQIKTRFLENLKLEALFDDFRVLSDQPVRYKGDGMAPGPFDYFLASSALCAAYFVKVYCKSREINTEDIMISQDNIVDPENRYQQIFKIHVQVPASLSEKDKKGIRAAIDRCTVKKTIQQGPIFEIAVEESFGVDNQKFSDFLEDPTQQTVIPGKDLPLEKTIQNMSKVLESIGIKLEITSWRNPVPHVWSVHIRDADSPVCFANGKGACKASALCSALGEYLERLSTNYFYADYALGEEIANAPFVHYPQEKWFKIEEKDIIPEGILNPELMSFYNPEGELRPEHLIDTNSANPNRGICALPYQCQSDGKTVFFPVALIGNIYVSNGMSAGNTMNEAKVQAISEIFERAVKNKIIREEITLPDIPQEIISLYPEIKAGIDDLEKKGYPIVVKDASLGGKYPVLCVALLNPHTGGAFLSFGAHPRFEVALERCLTELLQGRSFEGLNMMPPPSFNSLAISEPNNIIDHFIDSTGVVSWKFFAKDSPYTFAHWNFVGTSDQELDHLLNIFKNLNKKVYIAQYNHLGINACRVIIPDYSEIYPVDDLVWDNNNLAIKFREPVLNIHRLNDAELIDLLQVMEAEELDDYRPISEVIGVAFEESTVWGRLVVGELKCLILLALKQPEQAKPYVDMFQIFQDNTPERKRFYQILSILLDIKIDPKLSLEQYRENLSRLYGLKDIEETQDVVEGKQRFPGLTETNNEFKNLLKQKALLQSYRKLVKLKESLKS